MIVRSEENLIHVIRTPRGKKKRVGEIILKNINTKKYTRPVDNVVIATKGLQDRNINITAGTTVENKGKLILTKSSHRCKNMIFKST